jgi:hypothetical protein
MSVEMLIVLAMVNSLAIKKNICWVFAGIL